MLVGALLHSCDFDVKSFQTSRSRIDFVLVGDLLSCMTYDCLMVFDNRPCVLAVAIAQGVRPDQIIFTDVAAKNIHIRRSALADLFLDS